MYVIENKALREIKLSKLTNIVYVKESITLILCVIVLPLLTLMIIGNKQNVDPHNIKKIACF
jgi:maltodextrin utilization protein YvdJ